MAEPWKFEITVHNRETGETIQADARAYLLSMIGPWKEGETWRGWASIPKEDSERLCSYTQDMVNEKIEHPTWVLAEQLRNEQPEP